MAENFSSVPVLDFQDAISPDTKAKFLSQLRHALVDIGFFYLRNPPITEETRREFLEKSLAFFDLPLSMKHEIDMPKSKYFKGYTGPRHEKTAAEKDERESLTLGLFGIEESSSEDQVLPGASGCCLVGPNQWPEENTVPGFQPSVETYLSEIQTVSELFTIFIAEALDLDPAVFSKFFHVPRLNAMRLSCYPSPFDLDPNQTEFQGVGPHKDGSFLTFLLQGTEHSSLEVQTKSGSWIAVPPIPNTLVINIGRSLEAMTHGVCVATTHRVSLTREQYQGPNNEMLGKRISAAFFQYPSSSVTPEHLLLDIPPHILALRKDSKSDAETFFEGLFKTSYNDAILTNALTSHPEVGARWYPNELAAALRKQNEGKQLDDVTLKKSAAVH